MNASPPQNIQGKPTDAISPVENCPVKQETRSDEQRTNVIVMINDNGLDAHAGMRVDKGNAAILYDPAGSYSGCFKRPCRSPDGEPIERGTGDAFYGEPQEFEWGDYIAYQLADGPDVTGYEFEIPKSHAERIKGLIEASGGRAPFRCAETVSTVLNNSGGIFSGLPISTFPSSLGENLRKIPNGKIIRY